MTKEEAREQILSTCGAGWLPLVDLLYDNKPAHIHIKEVFQKWAALELRYEGEDDEYAELQSAVHLLSQKLCEQCGQSAFYTIIDGWETTLCEKHYAMSDAKQKYRAAPKS